MGPDVLHLVLALTIGDDTTAILFLNFGDLLLGTLDQSGLLLRNDHVIDSDGSSRTGGLPESEFLELIQSFDGAGLADSLVAAPDDVTKLFLSGNLVVEAKLLGPDLVEKNASHRGLDDRQFAVSINSCRAAIRVLKTNPCVNFHAGLGERQLNLAGLGKERHACFCGSLSILAKDNAWILREVVAPQRNILRRVCNRLAAGW